MTEFSQDLLDEKAALCALALADLKRYREIGTLDYLRAHPDTYYAVCYRFVSVIEALFDMGQIRLAHKELRATSEREVPVLLGRAGVIDGGSAQRFAEMHGFRNRLVHAYGTLDDEKVAAYLTERLSDVEELLGVLRKV